MTHRLLRVPVLFALLSIGLTFPARAAVHYSQNRAYAFPVAGPVSVMQWTHYHWDGGNAVDIGVNPALPDSSPLRAAFSQYDVVAVTAGTVYRSDNELGGTALILKGDDGHEYYYAHLHNSWVTTSAKVRAGTKLGRIGRTGRWAQYLEPHLHFAVSSQWHHGLTWKNDINAAEWIKQTFGLRYVTLRPAPYPADVPHLSPLAAAYRVTTTFLQAQAANPDLASVELALREREYGPRIAPSRVVAPMSGVVRVLRNTVLGLRIQITNLHSKCTIVLSGLATVDQMTGDVVRAGQTVGTVASALNYMYFDHGVLTDPLSTIERAK